MKPRIAALFCMPENGHFQRLRPLISGLARSGAVPVVFSHAKYRPFIEQAGGVFFDLFAAYPLESADAESIPVPSRYVTYAARFGREIGREVASTGASVVVHDTFAVVGRVAASILGLPRVNVCAGHALVPERIRPVLEKAPYVRTSPACLEAVKVLRDSFGVADASPFSYVSSLSPDVNVYGEPPEFLDGDERRAFEPVAFYGSLPDGNEGSGAPRPDERWFRGPGSREKRIYVSFGTVIWRYFSDTALRALDAIAAAIAGMPDKEAVVSLGGANVDPVRIARWSGPNVAVREFVDQWELLKEAGAFITHQGMNSTHEAVFHGVPMISYPFFMDQPGLSERCREFGLAVPLAAEPRGEIGESAVREALDRVAGRREAMRAALERARGWELSVIAGRPRVHERILGLMA